MIILTHKSTAVENQNSPETKIAMIFHGRIQKKRQIDMKTS